MCDSLAARLRKLSDSVQLSAAAGEQAQLAVLAAMRAHASDATVQGMACSLLTELHTLVPQLPSCHDAALAAIRAHPTEPVLLFRALDLLDALMCSGDAAQKRAVINAGASEAAVAAMRVSGRFMPLKSVGCRVLRRTRGCSSGDGTGACAGVADGVTDVILDALRAYKFYATHEPTDVTVALAALCEIVDGDETLVLRVADGGAIRLVLDIMYTYEPTSSEQTWGCALLWCLASTHSSTHARMVNGHALPVVVQAMEEHTSDAMTQIHAYRLISLPRLKGEH
jgi:hypothetical protein